MVLQLLLVIDLFEVGICTLMNKEMRKYGSCMDLSNFIVLDSMKSHIEAVIYETRSGTYEDVLLSAET